MDLQALTDHCLAKPGAEQDYPFGPGVLVLKVGGKIFAIISEDSEPLTISLKCEPEIATELRRAYAAVKPGYHLNKRHWNTVTVDGSVPDDQIGDWIDDSYDLVVAGLSRGDRDAIEASD